MDKLRELVMKGKSAEAAQQVGLLLEEGQEPELIMKNALIPAMDEVGDRFHRGEYFVPEMLMAARAMQKGVEVLKPRMVEDGVQALGKVVVGTVKGDLHDIGKHLVIMSLEGAGMEVVDLGMDVAPEKFAEAVKEHGPKVVGLSALLTTTMLAMKDTVQAIEKAGLRDQVKIMIGGAPVTQEFCDEIGADFYGSDSISGRNFAREVVAGQS